jgi:uncharacterized protein with HEPN domain
MSRHDAKVTLAQIDDAAEKIEMLCQGKTYEVFASDWIEVMALERLFLILGEAVKRLPEDLISDYPEVPWRKIASTRDRLAHGYDEVEGVILWNAASLCVVEMRTTVRVMLDKLNA